MTKKDKLKIALFCETQTNAIFLGLLGILDVPQTKVIALGQSMKQQLYKRMEGPYGDDMKVLFENNDTRKIQEYHRNFVASVAPQIITSTLASQ